MLDVVSEKKNYEEKIKALNNRIKKLEKQEKEINKTTGKMKEKFILEQKIRADKQEKKELIENFKKYNETEIEKRKGDIDERRKKRKEVVEKVSQENLMKNKVKLSSNPRKPTLTPKMKKYSGNLFIKTLNPTTRI